MHFPLANGVTGQMKVLVMTVDGGDATVIPTTFANGTSAITLDDANDSVTMVYGANGWAVLALQGATVNALQCGPNGINFNVFPSFRNVHI